MGAAARHPVLAVVDGTPGDAPQPHPPGSGPVRDPTEPLCSVSGVRSRLAAAGIRPVHRWGQNFLCDPAALNAVLHAAELAPNDRVLEIGAGLGTLTMALAPSIAQVVAIEIDQALCRLLRLEAAGSPARIDIRCLDALKASDQELELPAAPGTFKVVANIPYYLTSALIERLLGQWRHATLAVLMVQEEVARRLVAGPGQDGYGLLSLIVRYYSNVEIIRLVPAGAFWPRPAVRSAIVRMRRLPQPPVEADEASLLSVMRTAFGQRRKQLRNSLGGPPLALERDAAQMALVTAGIDPSRRAETLELAEFAALTRAIDACRGAQTGA